MNAQPNPEPSEPREITQFRSKYAEALQAAEVSAEHTATQGWQDLYGAHQLKIQKNRADLADRTGKLTEVMRMRFLDKDEEKAIGEIKSELAELRESDESFRRQVIDPIIAPMRECERVMEEARAIVRKAEHETPLHTRGLIESMETVIDTVPRVKFVMASGRLVVGDGA